MSISRRAFLQTLLASAAAAATYDPELALWVPGAKTIMIPAPRSPLAVGDWVVWDEAALAAGLRDTARAQIKTLGSAQYAYYPTLAARGLRKATDVSFDKLVGLYCGTKDGHPIVAQAGVFSKSEMRILHGQQDRPAAVNTGRFKGGFAPVPLIRG